MSYRLLFIIALATVASYAEKLVAEEVLPSDHSPSLVLHQENSSSLPAKGKSLPEISLDLAAPTPTSPHEGEASPTALTASETPSKEFDLPQTTESISLVETDGASTAPAHAQATKEISVNFNNLAMVEYIRFISGISNKNFIFEEEDLQFNVTIVSEEPTTVENLMAALMQELRIRDLSLIEQANNLIIYRNPKVRSPARIVANDMGPTSWLDSELVTRVFRLNTLDPVKAGEIIRPLLSEQALVEVLVDTSNLIITDLVGNVNKIAQLIGTLDAPNSGITIGQYAVRNAFVDSLVDLANKILQPIAQGNPFILVPYSLGGTIFVVSNPFIVEKALAILQHLDLNEGETKILSLEGLRPSYSSGGQGVHRPEKGMPVVNSMSGGAEGVVGPGGSMLPGIMGGTAPGFFGRPGAMTPGQMILPGAPSEPGERLIEPSAIPESFPLGGIGTEGHVQPHLMPTGQNASFTPGGIGVEGSPSIIFDENRGFMPGGIGASTQWSRELPHGHIERTLFFIHKLRYRKGDQIEIALKKIGAALQASGTANVDFIGAINSSQWIESSNALIFSGPAVALDKVRELILELDLPLRQVFIEMLILDTTIQDSLSYSVDWVNRFGGGSTTGEQGFRESAPPLLSANQMITTTEQVTPPIPPNLFPSATNFLVSGGYTAGIIGTHLTHNGLHFSSIGALVNAIHTDAKTNILLNPKIITEDNNTAEIFVGGTDRYKTQSVTNDLGDLVTNNFQLLDVGTTLRVTPLIGSHGIITLEIIQETTDAAAGANNPLLANNQDVNLVQVLTKTRTVTKIHVPNGFFVILSGMIQNTDTRSYTRIPCLGGIPIVGSVGKSQSTSDRKRNLMLFIRPLIVDTDTDLEDVTKRQQDIYREKTKFRRAWNYEVDEGLNFLNIKPTDSDEIGCEEK